MDNFFFWKKWNSHYKILFYVSAGLLLFSNLFLGFCYFSGIDFLQEWGSIQELSTVPVDLHKFTDHYHEFQVKTINYLVYEKYTATNIAFPAGIAGIYVGILFLAITLYCTFLTTFSKYFYYAGVFLLMIFLATLNVDLLEVFSSESKLVLSIFIIALGGTSYGIYTFFYHLTLLQRFAIFLALNTLLFGFIYLASPMEARHIHFHLAGYGSASLIVLTGLYVLYLGIENLLFIVFLNSSNQRGGLVPYIILNLLYLGVLILKFYFRIDVFGVNEYTLVMLASVLTIWGTLKRNEDNTKGDTVARVLMIMTLGSIVISTLAFHYAHQNNSLLSAFQKLTLSAFLGYGAMFFLYVMVNFIERINYKQAVYPHVFRPAKLSAYHMYIMGTIATMGVITQKYDKKTLYDGLSGYYNAVADYYYEKEDFSIAEPFYEQAKLHAPLNVKSHLALASLSLKKGEIDAATEHFVYCTETGGSERAFLQLANIYELKGDYFSSLFTLKEGLQKHPESAHLWNNLGLLSKKSSLADSTIHYFSRATQLAGKDDFVALNNLISYLIKKDFTKEAEELISSLDADRYDMKTKAAIAAFNAKNGIFNAWKKQPIQPDTLLRTDELAYLFNHFINNIELLDSSDLQAIDSTLSSQHNIFNYESLTLLKAFYEFYQGDPRVAREHMATLASGTSFYAGYYNNLLGYWMMMHHNYPMANRYMAVADRYNFEQSAFNHALIETILQSEAADTLWSKLASSDTSNTTRYGILSKAVKPSELTDFEKLLYLSLGHYDQYAALSSGCTDASICALIDFEQINGWMERNQMDKAMVLWQEKREALEKHVSEDPLNILKASIFVSSGESDKALALLEQTQIPFELQSKALFVQAKALENRKEVQKANTTYTELVTRFPFYEKGLLNASRFMQDQGNAEKAYEIVVNGVKALPESIELKKMYVWHCLDQRLLDYARETVAELNRLMSPNDFHTFKSEYDKRISEIEQRYASWE